VLAITCPRCHGGDPECARCGGIGLAGVRRCPASHNDADLALAFSFYARLESGLLPGAGGWLDQTASFVGFCRAVDAERGAIERDAERKSEAVRRMTSGKGARGGNR